MSCLLVWRPSGRCPSPERRVLLGEGTVEDEDRVVGEGYLRQPRRGPRPVGDLEVPPGRKEGLPPPRRTHEGLGWLPSEPWRGEGIPTSTETHTPRSRWKSLYLSSRGARVGGHRSGGGPVTPLSPAPERDQESSGTRENCLGPEVPRGVTLLLVSHPCKRRVVPAVGLPGRPGLVSGLGHPVVLV